MSLSLSDKFGKSADGAQNEQEELQRDHIRKVQNYAEQGLMGEGKGAAEKTGAIKSAVEMAMESGGRSLEEKEQKERKKLHELLKMLDLLDQQLQAVNEALDALAELEELYKNGKLDPDNPQHAALMQKAGITWEDLEERGQDAIDDRRDDLSRSKDDIEKRVEEAQGLAREMEQDPDNPELHQKLEQLKETVQGKDKIYIASINTDSYEAKEAFLDSMEDVPDEAKQELLDEDLTSDSRAVSASSFDLDALIASERAKSTTSVAKAVSDDADLESCREEFNTCSSPEPQKPEIDTPAPVQEQTVNIGFDLKSG